MNNHISLKKGLLIFVLMICLAGCNSPLETPTPSLEFSATDPPELVAQPTETSIPATLTPSPTNTPYPTSSPQPPTITVCSTGCDFQTVQAAIDHPTTLDGDIIGVLDEVHTEAGILVSKNLTIQGIGPENTIVQAHEIASEASQRVFRIPENVQVTLRDMTIQKGYPTEAPFSGGGILNQGNLTIENCRVQNNKAADGGGVWNHGTLLIINSIISHNYADGAGDPWMECGTGGGINNRFQSTLTIHNSVIKANVAEGKGGGLHIACEGTATIANSEISENKSTKNGGGIFLKGSLTLIDSQVTHNSTPADGGGVIVYGILNYYESAITGNHAGGNCIIWGDDSYKGQGEVAVESNSTIPLNNCHLK
jgi:predicted outer membrane repeat protein